MSITGPIAPFRDARYAAPGFLFGEAPNAFLESRQPLLRPGVSALTDLAARKP